MGSWRWVRGVGVGNLLLDGSRLVVVYLGEHRTNVDADDAYQGIPEWVLGMVLGTSKSSVTIPLVSSPFDRV